MGITLDLSQLVTETEVLIVGSIKWVGTFLYDTLRNFISPYVEGSLLNSNSTLWGNNDQQKLYTVLKTAETNQ